MKTTVKSFGSEYTKYLSDEELCRELNFAATHLQALINEFTERSLRGSKKIKVTYQHNNAVMVDGYWTLLN